MISKVFYKGDLRTEAIHIDSGEKLTTDAPKDNEGQGEFFSPTDLVATALASCILTIMGIVAKRSNLNILEACAEVQKTMGSNPRRIKEVRIKIIFKNKLKLKDREKLERAAKTCPVGMSLSEKLNEVIEFIYL
ncbi:MAG: OsmC family protein [Fidelibacterota bacterium]|jgi:putative redox protein|tara:strand:- start:61 stop:462 length:402 start_codon:yes stop_codon:yes gene_type:complete